MNIILYKTSSPKNQLNKSLTQVADITGESNESIGNVNTSFILSDAHLTNVKNSNYMYSGITGKYYFITDYEIKNQTVKIIAKEDVLMSFKTQILNNACTISKNENIANSYLADNGYQIKTYKDIFTRKFPRGLTTDSIILMTIG